MAELAAVPCTSAGLINIAPAVPAATPMNLRRSSLPEEFARCFTSSDMYPPCAKQIQCDFPARDRKSTRLNSSHGYISYAVFCLKKKKTKETNTDRKKV